MYQVIKLYTHYLSGCVSWDHGESYMWETVISNIFLLHNHRGGFPLDIMGFFSNAFIDINYHLNDVLPTRLAEVFNTECRNLKTELLGKNWSRGPLTWIFISKITSRIPISNPCVIFLDCCQSEMKHLLVSHSQVFILSYLPRPPSDANLSLILNYCTI